jgi:manganese oxidase
MHVHGGPFTIVARDGVTLSPSARYDADTINLGPGQCYDVIWPTRRPGKWLIHCHIPHHTENDNVEEKRWGRTDDVDRCRRQLEWLRRMAGATEIQAREQG